MVSSAQLRGLGLSGGRIEKWRSRGRLHRLHNGVYTVGHPVVSRQGRWRAAVMACGEGAVLSNRSAGAHWGIRDWRGLPEVTAPRRRKHKGILTSEAVLPADEVTIKDGIPVTTPARTILDLTATLSAEQLRRALGQLQVGRLFDVTGLQVLLARHKGKRGIAKLRGLLPDEEITRSAFERRFRADTRSLAPPERNVTLALDGDFVEVDLLWRKQKLVVELDSREYHLTEQAFERDRERDRRLAVAGFRVIRITPSQAKEAIADLHGLLG